MPVCTQRIGMDHDNYPEAHELQSIVHWPGNDLSGLFAYLRERWRYADCGYWQEIPGVADNRPVMELHLHTGGWSGNEELLDALRANQVAWLLTWRQSQVGGHYRFRLDRSTNEPLPNNEAPPLAVPSELPTESSNANEGPAPESGYKQVLVVRRDLKMRPGKTAVQAAHAAMGALTRGPGARIREAAGGASELVIPLDAEAQAWLTGIFRKICVYVQSEAELLELHGRALAAGLRCSLIQDSGLTEFGGVPTYTVLALGPHANERLDPLTRHLPLL